MTSSRQILGPNDLSRLVLVQVTPRKRQNMQYARGIHPFPFRPDHTSRWIKKIGCTSSPPLPRCPHGNWEKKTPSESSVACSSSSAKGRRGSERAGLTCLARDNRLARCQWQPARHGRTDGRHPGIVGLGTPHPSAIDSLAIPRPFLRKDPALSHGSGAKSWDQAARRRGPVRSKSGVAFATSCLRVPGGRPPLHSTCAGLLGWVAG